MDTIIAVTVAVILLVMILVVLTFLSTAITTQCLTLLGKKHFAKKHSMRAEIIWQLVSASS